MVLAVISDTHLPRGRRRLPDACVDRLRHADRILHAGDFSTVAVLGELRRLGPPVIAVCGNVEEDALREQLPTRVEVELEGVRLGMVHDGGPRATRLRRLRERFPDAAAVVFGHSHVPLLEHDGSFQIFNPGSPTDRRGQPEHTMGIARIERGSIAFEHVALGA
jgi:putative phosphoesterase